jgi:hypothetical protein
MNVSDTVVEKKVSWVANGGGLSCAVLAAAPECVNPYLMVADGDNNARVTA